MLIRLLGEEEAALAYTGPCPFTDVSGNSAKYAGYAYSKGYTSGTTPTTFGNGPLKPNAFLTFCLRSLGYSDKEGDFTYGTAFLMAAEIGLIGPGEFTDQSSALLRSGCAQIAHNTLLTRVKGSDQKLIDKLVASGAVDKAKAEASGIFRASPFQSFYGRDVAALQKAALNRYGAEPLKNAGYYGMEGVRWTDNPQTELEYVNNLRYAFLVGDYSLAFTFKDEEAVRKFIAFTNNDYDAGRLKDVYTTFPELMGHHCNGTPNRAMGLVPGGAGFYWSTIRGAVYTNTELYRQQKIALEKALEISEELHASGKITDNMSKQEIVQVYYDYLQNYGVKPFNGFRVIADGGNRGELMKYETAYSTLILKEAQCCGRAAAFNLFMHIEGIPAAAISCHMKGAPKDDGHGLNYLVIDGQEYLCDWGNNIPLMSFEKAKNSYLDYVDDFSLKLARAATGYSE